jgi:hypothetical protein
MSVARTVRRISSIESVIRLCAGSGCPRRVKKLMKLRWKPSPARVAHRAAANLSTVTSVAAANGCAALATTRA